MTGREACIKVKGDTRVHWRSDKYGDVNPVNAGSTGWLTDCPAFANSREPIFGIFTGERDIRLVTCMECLVIAAGGEH